MRGSARICLIPQPGCSAEGRRRNPKVEDQTPFADRHLLRSALAEYSLRPVQKGFEILIRVFRPSSNLADYDHYIIVEDRIDEAVLPLAKPVKNIIQLDAPGGPRVFAKRTHGRDQPLSLLFRHPLQLLLYIAVNLQGVGHRYWPIRPSISSASAATDGSSRYSATACRPSSRSSRNSTRSIRRSNSSGSISIAAGLLWDRTSRGPSRRLAKYDASSDLNSVTVAVLIMIHPVCTSFGTE